jgi:hypothetical protein
MTGGIKPATRCYFRGFERFLTSVFLKREAISLRSAPASFAWGPMDHRDKPGDDNRKWTKP